MCFVYQMSNSPITHVVIKKKTYIHSLIFKYFNNVSEMSNHLSCLQKFFFLFTNLILLHINQNNTSSQDTLILLTLPSGQTIGHCYRWQDCHQDMWEGLVFPHTFFFNPLLFSGFLGEKNATHDLVLYFSK